MSISRRGLITGLVSFLAAPAIVRVASLDMVRGVPLPVEWPYRDVAIGYDIMRVTLNEYLYSGLYVNQLRGWGVNSLNKEASCELTATRPRLTGAIWPLRF